MTNEHVMVHGAIAEFGSAADLLHAAESVRDAGYEHFDCHSPFPIHGMDAAMGLKRSPLGWIVGIMALTGCGLAFLLQGWVSTTAYPLVIAGKPFFSFQAYVPIGFGIAVLFGALSAVIGMLALNRLPQLWHPVFFSNNFDKVTTDGFIISIEARDKKFDAIQTAAFLAQIGGRNVELLKG